MLLMKMSVVALFAATMLAQGNAWTFKNGCTWYFFSFTCPGPPLPPPPPPPAPFNPAPIIPSPAPPPTTPPPAVPPGYKSPLAGCNCTGKPPGFIRHDTDCSIRCLCGTSQNVKARRPCTTNKFVNPITGQCTYTTCTFGTPNGFFSCAGKAAGKYGDPNDCTSYFECDASGDRDIVFCPPNQFYNPAPGVQACGPVSSVPSCAT